MYSMKATPITIAAKTNKNQVQIDVIDDIDLVCMMSVNPGFGGQSFIENAYNKVKELKQLIGNSNSKALIEIACPHK